MLVDQLRIHGASLAFCIPGESTADFGPALERALSAPGPALVAVKASQEAISARS